MQKPQYRRIVAEVSPEILHPARCLLTHKFVVLFKFLLISSVLFLNPSLDTALLAKKRLLASI